MPVYTCITLDPQGAEQKATITAGSSSEAAAVLRSQGRFVVRITAAAGGGAEESEGGFLGKDVELGTLLGIFSRPKKKDIVLMLRQLAVMLESGVSLVQAFNSLQRQARGRGLKRLIQRIRSDIEAGGSLSASMQKQRGVFSEQAVNMVKAAEMSGELDIIMARVADQLEAAMAFRQQMITSMIYPALVIVMTVVAVGVLALVVVPKFAPILKGGGRSMPWPTQALLDAVDFVQIWWWEAVLGVAGAFVAVPLIRKTDEGGYLVDWILMRIPVVGRILQCGVVVNFSRNLSTLLASGVPLSDALKTVRGTLRNHVAMRVVDRMARRILEGDSLSIPLKEAERVFPPMVGEMVATGEETGEMGKVLDLVAKTYQNILENLVKRMNALIEPTIIVILGAMVGFVFFGLMAGVLAIYNA
jgi:type II secretory pathway component PulF